MVEFTAFDAKMMARAIRLAEKGQFLTRPNPRVGCVISKDNQIVGEGYHQLFGSAHAEVNALKQAGNKAQGATAYVTLEPCSHFGKTGPCASALIDAGIKKVVCAMGDPNPSVNGQGFERLRSAGIEVAVGLMASSARSLNKGFIKRTTQGLPYVRLKLAQSVDGRTAMASGESQWITGSGARQDVQRLRASSDAIITGSGTVLQDNPSLNVRFIDWSNPPDEQAQGAFRQPLRVVLDRSGQLKLSNPFFNIEQAIWWVSPTTNKLMPSHIQLIDSKSCSLEKLLKALAQVPCNEVLIECGAQLAGAFIKAQLVDELIIYTAAKLMGSDARSLATLPFAYMSEAIELCLVDQRMVGDDVRSIYQMKSNQM